MQSLALILSVFSLSTLVTNGDINFDSWDRALQANVHPGVRDNISINVVNYTSLAQDSNFAQFLTELASTDTSSLSYHEFYALFINAYNALAMKMIIDHPCAYNYSKPSHTCEPIVSMWTISPNVFDWNAGIIGGTNYTLDEIETYLRKPQTFYNNGSNSSSEDWEEIPLVHSCMVCGGCSCPNVRRTAFTTANVTFQMADNMRHFLNNTKKGSKLDEPSNTLYLSKIFYWFGSDFTQFNNISSVQQYLLPYMPESEQTYVKNNLNTVEVEFMDYDWDLNGPPPCNCGTS